MKPSFTGFSMPCRSAWVPALVYDCAKIPLGPAFFTLPENVTKYLSMHRRSVPTKMVAIGLDIAVRQYVDDSFPFIARHMAMRFEDDAFLSYRMAAKVVPVFVDPSHFVFMEAFRAGDIVGSFALFLRMYHADVVKREGFFWPEAGTCEGFAGAHSEISGRSTLRRRENDIVRETRIPCMGSGEL